jgi:hypothetical protein
MSKLYIYIFFVCALTSLTGCNFIRVFSLKDNQIYGNFMVNNASIKKNTDYNVFDKDKSEKIKSLVKASNYCENDEDCKIIEAKCPFGCYVTVNKKHYNKVKKAIDNFKSECQYSCMLRKTVSCVGKKCKMRFY